MLDYTWKIVQVKLAFMVRLSNWKVSSDLKDIKKQYNQKLEARDLAHQAKQDGLRKEIETLKKEKE